MFLNLDNFFNLAEKYGGTDTVQVVLSAQEKMTTKENLASFWQFFEATRNIEGITHTSCFIPGVVLSETQFKKTNLELIDEENPAFPHEFPQRAFLEQLQEALT